MDNNRAYIEWLNSRIEAETAYHNHKETMAWLATSLYLPTIVGLGHFVGTTDLCCLIKALLTLVIVIATAVFICLFINMQFTERWKAADRIRILLESVVKLFAGELKLTEENWRMCVVNEIPYPKFLKKKMNEVPLSRCWKQALKLLFTLCWCKLDPRWKTEFASYIMVILASVFAIILTWVA